MIYEVFYFTDTLVACGDRAHIGCYHLRRDHADGSYDSCAIGDPQVAAYIRAGGKIAYRRPTADDDGSSLAFLNGLRCERRP
jgi:hypothetical protein